MSECDREAWIMRRPWPCRGCSAVGMAKVFSFHNNSRVILGERPRWKRDGIFSLVGSGNPLEIAARVLVQ